MANNHFRRLEQAINRVNLAEATTAANNVLRHYGVYQYVLNSPPDRRNNMRIHYALKLKELRGTPGFNNRKIGPSVLWEIIRHR